MTPETQTEAGGRAILPFSVMMERIAETFNNGKGFDGVEAFSVTVREGTTKLTLAWSQKSAKKPKGSR